MIRSLTFVCALLAGGSGLYLYSEKHRTTLLDQQISRIVADTQQVRERTSMLRAEWALLNQPDRLQLLSGRFLPQLGAMAPTQFVQMASLDSHLPAVGAETPPHPIVTPETAPAMVGVKPGVVRPAAQQDEDNAAIASTATPRPSVSNGSTQVAMVQPIAQAASHVAANRLAQAHPKVAAPHHEVMLADADQADSADVASVRRVAVHPVTHTAHVAAPVRLASAGNSRPAVTTVASAYAHPPVISAAAWHPARASWSMARPVSYSTPVAPGGGGSAIGSSLGSSRSTLPAPVPVSDGN